MLKIQSTGGAKLTISKTLLTLNNGACHKNTMRLVDIQDGSCLGKIVPLSDACMYGGNFDAEGYYTVDFRTRRIGCCKFSIATWKVLMAEVKKAKKNS